MMKNPLRPEATGMVLGLIGVVIFGATLPMTHIALQGFSPLFITCCRAVIAATAAGIGLVLQKRRWPQGETGRILGAALCVVIGFPIFSSIALQTIPASHGGVVLGILPLTTSIFAALVDGERPGPAFWAYGVAGAALVVWFSMRSGGFHLQAGDVWLFAAAIAASLGYVLLAKVSRARSGFEAISWVLVMSLPVSLAGTLASASSGIAAPGPAEIGALAYLGLMSMFGGYIFWNAGLALGGVARVAQVQLLQTFVTLGIAVLIAGESVDLATILFAVAVAAVVWLGRRARIG